ncbi:MAG: glycosyltransferase [Candidatus Saccharibacteria bacterium]|nr:glycosyltransferase [Candidatus Saccharibacteria bacterium]
MKKVVIFTLQLKTPGGIERFVTTLASILSEDYKVEIVANYGKSNDYLAFPLPENVDLKFLTPTQPEEISMKRLITNLKWHRIPTEIIRRIRINHTRNQAFKTTLANLSADFIITDRALYNSLINKFYHGPAKKIATDHNFHQFNQKYINNLLKSLNGFDALVVATEELYTFYKPKIAPTKCFCIPNPLDNIPTKKSQLNTKNILSVGRLVPEKDFPTLLKIMDNIAKEDTDIHLTIIGEGNERANLENLIENYHLSSRVTLTGALPQSEIAKYYLDSSLFVLTSKTEAFGLVLTEAMSYGVPCIAFDRSSGARAQITDKTGFLIKNSDLKEMARTIIILLNNKDTLKRLQKNINSEITTKYNEESIRQSWQKVLQA